MKRGNHTFQGLMFIVACFLVGLLAYQALTGRTNKAGGNTQAAPGNSQDTYTMVTEMAGTPDSDLMVENTSGASNLIVEDLGPREESEDEKLDRMAEALATPQNNGGNCQARFLQRVHAIQNEEAVKEAGETLFSVTQYWRNSATDEASFCAHGDYCYPAYVKEGGRLTKTMELINCTIQSQRPRQDGDEIMYPVY